MSYFSTLATDITNFTATIIVTVAIHVPFLMHALMSVPYVPPQLTHSLATTSTSTHVPVSAIKPPYASLPSVMSSSTAQVGEFTVVVNCTDKNPTGIEILKNGSVVQTLGLDAAIGGSVGECLPAESQDINFDGYPDFMVLSGAGSGGGAFSYWLYNPSTQQFYCPEANNNCGLMNPTFYPATKKILSVDFMGAGSVDAQTYGVSNGKLVLLNDVQGSPVILDSLNTKVGGIIPIPYTFSLDQTSFNFEKDSINNTSTGDTISFSDAPTGTLPQYNALLNGQKIGVIAGYESTGAIFSPNNAYASFEMVINENGSIREGINIIDFKNQKLLFVQPPPDLSSYIVGEEGIIESYTWDSASDAIDMVAFAVSYENNALFRVSPRQIWRYDIATQQYTLVQTLSD